MRNAEKNWASHECGSPRLRGSRLIVMTSRFHSIKRYVGKCNETRWGSIVFKTTDSVAIPQAGLIKARVTQLGYLRTIRIKSFVF